VGFGKSVNEMMKRQGTPKFNSGFSLVELAIVVIVIGILMAILLDRLAFYRQQAEDIMFKTTLVNMRTGLRIRVMLMSNSGTPEGLRTLQGVNPITFLEQPPSNYLGELDPVEEERLPRGHWYYKKRDHYLRYLLNSRSFVANEGQKHLNFKVKLLHVTKNSACQLDQISNCRAVLEQAD
jgi:prepilin-type N-terminal cleavage/methylation domain-containing protein